MPKSKSPSFILDIPLVVTPVDDRCCMARMEAGRRLYNAVLCEALKRLSLMRQSKAWQKARKIANKNERAAAFKACTQAFGFSEYSLHSVAAAHKNNAGFSDRLGAHETQKLAKRVWEAVTEYAYGARGKPRFKGRSRPLKSLEGKSNKAGILWRAATGRVMWNGLSLVALLPTQDQDPWLHEGLRAKTKFCRITWRIVNGRRRWFVQLVQEGKPPAKYDFHADGEVGVDVGPSSIAVVSDHAVALEKFAPGVDQPWAEMRRLQRAMDRSRRATNPHCYNANGTFKKGAKIGVVSRRYLELKAQLAELERTLAATRKREHGELANKILGVGLRIRTEDISYRAFQKCFGRSAKTRAPGAFMDRLSRKAVSAGGDFKLLNTRALRMSQYDHVTDSYTKKPLSQRWHRLGGGNTLIQRDCYSAFLAKNASNDEHNPHRLSKSWSAAESLLARAGLCIKESASGWPSGCPSVAIPSEQIARERRRWRSLGRDVVAATQEPGYPAPIRL